jgi:hypothetical protein
MMVAGPEIAVSAADPMLDDLWPLLEQAGLPTTGAGSVRDGRQSAVTLHRLTTGGNNAVFRVDVPQRSLLLKHYFSDVRDDRDRMGAEVAFARFLWEHGVRAIPQLLACSAERRLALWEFVAGERLSPGAVTDAAVGQALDFCRQVFAIQTHPQAQSLALAAEASFSVHGHLACVDRRVGRLTQTSAESAEQREVQQFAETELAPCWRQVCDRVRRACQSAGVSGDTELPVPQRCLSPSDFGFHNALQEADGRLRFLDFEYAGWDDPAKLICDFFCQVEVPVPRRYLPEFAAAIAAAFPDSAALRRRSGWLLPVYRIKWCCIVLNEFLPAGRARRRFSAADLRSDHQPSVQLAKARRILEQLRDDERESGV